MFDMLSREGVFLAKFDFCQLGMVVSKGSGKEGNAKKRTAVMTNSKHLAETLRLAQCDKSHSHVQLVGGKAKQCEVYPDKNRPAYLRKHQERNFGRKVARPSR